MRIIDNKSIQNLKPRLICHIENGDCFLEVTTSEEMTKTISIPLEMAIRITQNLNKQEMINVLKEIEI